MGRYTGPKHRISRREGVNLLDKTSKSLIRRLSIPPGMHGAKRKRQMSEYGLQLREKQKLKVVYGVMERQLGNLVRKIQRVKGDTGELLVAALETRLDNVVYRLGFAKSRYQARQFVSHGHILVNGKKVTIPSYHVKVDDVVSPSEKIKKTYELLAVEEPTHVLSFLNRKGMEGVLVRVPTREDMETPFDTQLIIEYYSR